MTSTRNVFKEFCASTSLHGYSYLYNANSIILKIVWAFVILTATGLGAMFLTKQTKEYLSGTVITTIESFSTPLEVRMKYNYSFDYAVCIFLAWSTTFWQ